MACYRCIRQGKREGSCQLRKRRGLDRHRQGKPAHLRPGNLLPSAQPLQKDGQMIYASLSYSNRDFKEMTPEQQIVFEENWPRMNLIMRNRRERYKDNPEEINNVHSYEYETRQRITMEEANALEQAGIGLELEGIDGTMLQRNKD